MNKSRLVNLHWGDMTDSSSLIRIIQQVKLDEIYNLAAQSHVKVSFDVPEYTSEVELLLGDPTKARTLLGWNPTKTSFAELVKIMVEHDMTFVRKLHLKAQLDREE